MASDASHRAGIRRLGVFGGAFDPPHNTHVTMVRTALQQLNLDELRVFPTGQAWHKPRQLSDAEHRLAMAQIAFGEFPKVRIDEREILRPGPTYTIDTLRELVREYPLARLFLIMGEDQADALQSWREWREIIQLATISVAGRAPSAHSAFELGSPRALQEPLPADRTETLQVTPSSTSATEIRELVADAQGIAHLVPERIARYIEQHHLYPSP